MLIRGSRAGLLVILCYIRAIGHTSYAGRVKLDIGICFFQRGANLLAMRRKAGQCTDIEDRDRHRPAGKEKYIGGATPEENKSGKKIPLHRNLMPRKLNTIEDTCGLPGLVVFSLNPVQPLNVSFWMFRPRETNPRTKKYPSRPQTTVTSPRTAIESRLSPS